jgi:hypothetical protein
MVPASVNAVWSMGFMHGQLSSSTYDQSRLNGISRVRCLRGFFI